MGGFSAFSVTGCLPYWCSGGVGWAAALPLYYLCFSCAGWLAGICWILHPVSGSSLWGCVCSLGDSVIALLAFPYLRVGALLACSVCGVSCEVCSLGCPLWLVILFMSLFVLHLLLGWGGLVTGLWPHLQLLCVGLFWCLCCAVLSPWLLVAPSSFSCVSLGFFLWRLLDLGWLAAVLSGFLPSFGGNSPSHVLAVFAWRFLLCGCPGSLSFSLALSWGSSSRFQFFADSLGWLRIVLGYPPSVAWQRCVLHLVFCQGLVGLPLWGCDASRCLSPPVFMVFAMGSLVSGRAVFFLSPRSSRSLSLLLVGLVPGLSVGSPASGWRWVLGMRSSWWLSLLCIPSGCGHPLGQ